MKKMKVTTLPRIDLAIGDPYQQYLHSIGLLHEYIDSAPESAKAPLGVPSVPDLHRLAWRLGRKPVLCLFGEFDAGKSTLANAMLSEDFLPTGFQPTTRLPTYIFSSQERPPYITGQVGAFAKGVDVTRLQDQDYSKQFLIASGGTELLQQSSVQDDETGNLRASNVQNLVFFSDAPILSVCSILDLPGYDNDDEDTNRADSANVIAEIAMYLSPLNGFLKSHDLLRIGQLIRQLPAFPLERDNINPLRNFYIVCTHVQPGISARSIEDVFDRACDRAWRHLAKPLQDRSSSTTVKADLRNRFFSFWEHRSFGVNQLGDDLRTLLCDELPVIWDEVAEREIVRLRSDVSASLSKELENYSRMISDRKNAKIQFEKLMDREPENKQKIANARSLIRTRIPEYMKSNSKEISKIYRRIISVKYIEELIRKQFPKKRDAQENTAAYLIEGFRDSSDEVVKESSEQFSKDVEAYIGEVERFWIDAELGKFSVGIPFNARGVFRGVLAGLGGTGALAVWSSLTFGSSFGFYVLTAKFVGVLSAFGISISGGTAAVIGAISVIGAPLAIGTGLAIIGGLLGWIFGKSWQKRLAEKIQKEFRKKLVLKSYQESVASFWNKTAVAFEESCKVLEEARSAEIENYRGLLFDGDKGRDAIEESIARAEEYRDFFVAVPWSSSK